MKKRSYYFLCVCACGQKSEPLPKDGYIRLEQGKQWLAKDCKLENANVVAEYLGGMLVQQSDY